MVLNFKSFPKKHLYKLLSNLIEKNNINNYDKLKTCLSRYKETNEGENYNIFIKEFDNLCILSTPKISNQLRHTNTLIDRVIHQFKICIIDKKSFLPIVYLEKSLSYDNNSYFNDYLKESIENIDILNDINDIKVYKNYVGNYIILFSHYNEYFVLVDENVYNLNDEKLVVRLFRELLNNKSVILNELDNKKSYHFILIHYRLENCINFQEMGSEYTELIFVKTVMKGSLEENESTNLGKCLLNKKLYFSCIDELLVNLENINYNDVVNKQLTHRGYLVRVGSYDFEPIYIKFDTELYSSINNFFKGYKNVHQVYLELYQNDKLNDVLPYISIHHTDIIRRINMSLKTIAKEILNIYFMTRNHRNDKLYDLLPKVYKDTLFNIHKIFILKRDEDRTNIDELGLIEKRSLTIENVYGYLKKLNTQQLIKIYQDRINLLKDIKILKINEHNFSLKKELNDILYDSCINTLTLTTLMNQ